jgi:hypothetical protein
MMHSAKKGIETGKMHIMDFLFMLVAQQAATIEQGQLVQILGIKG